MVWDDNCFTPSHASTCKETISHPRFLSLICSESLECYAIQNVSLRSQGGKSYSSIYCGIITLFSRYCLCVVLVALGQSEAALECQFMALDLEAASPIFSFTCAS